MTLISEVGRWLLLSVYTVAGCDAPNPWGQNPRIESNYLQECSLRTSKGQTCKDFGYHHSSIGCNQFLPPPVKYAQTYECQEAHKEAFSHAWNAGGTVDQAGNNQPGLFNISPQITPLEDTWAFPDEVYPWYEHHKKRQHEETLIYDINDFEGGNKGENFEKKMELKILKTNG